MNKILPTRVISKLYSDTTELRNIYRYVHNSFDFMLVKHIKYVTPVNENNLNPVSITYKQLTSILV